MCASGERIRLTPPASARSHSPERRLWHGQVDGDERGGAGGVDGQTRPVQAEQVRETPGDDARAPAGPGVRIDAVAAAEEKSKVVGVGDADEDPGRGPGEAVRGDPRVFERLPADLEQQALLRIHARGFARRDPEERRVEVGRVLDERARSRPHRARSIGVGIVVRVDVPPIGRHLPDRVNALRQGPPQGFGVNDAAGQPAAEPHDGDRIGARRLGARQPGAQRADLEQRSLHRGEVAIVRVRRCHQISPAASTRTTEGHGTVAARRQDPRAAWLRVSNILHAGGSV